MGVYSVWIEPASIKELTSQSVINVTEAYEFEIKKGAFTNTSVLTKNPGCAVVIMLNSFLSLFNVVVERLKLFINMNEKLELNELCTSLHENSRNYVLNKFFHFYYEKISSILTSKCVTLPGKFVAIAEMANLTFKRQFIYKRQHVRLLPSVHKQINCRLVRERPF